MECGGKARRQSGRYEHDAIDQLIRVRYGLSGGVPERDVQYNYDLLGNRVSVVEDGVSTAYTVNALNQYVTVGGEPLTYDANGNLTSGLGLSLQYDAQNRLVSVATASNVVMLAYDGRNRCVRRTVVTEGGGSVVYLVWGHAQSEQWGLLEERGPSGELVGRYVHGPGIDELVAGMSAGGGVVYYHQDHLNSTVAVTDESGALVEQYRYDVFGKPFFLAPDGTARSESAYGVRFLFTGREYLASLGLYDYRHRTYSPTLGRFLQVDVISLWDGMRYVRNSPLCLLDPLGWQVRQPPIDPLRREQARLRRELLQSPEPTNNILDEVRTGTIRTVKDVTEAAFDPVGAVVDQAVKQVPVGEKAKDVYDLATQPKKWVTKKVWDLLWGGIDYGVRKLTEWPEEASSKGGADRGAQGVNLPKEESPCEKKRR